MGGSLLLVEKDAISAAFWELGRVGREILNRLAHRGLLLPRRMAFGRAQLETALALLMSQGFLRLLPLY